ncbi:MAG: D-tyrosyl-tRNA(Tyr) deacylase [Phycisphaerales bacterium]|nr:D-tyrosyl-tRNA(Tyr) deacylase [Phycisphaerales bacterium]
MRAVVQRVSGATLNLVDDGAEREHTAIGPGLVVLLGVELHDTDDDLAWMARKILNRRIFRDDEGKMNRSLLNFAEDEDKHGLLLVPNFTVAGRAHKGRRPDFTSARSPTEAATMFDQLAGRLRDEAPAVRIETGVFGAHMHVALVNDGPVTIWLDSRV